MIQVQKCLYGVLLENVLKAHFPEAQQTDYYTFISGFGSGYHTASIWKIPEIILSDRRKRDRIIINNLLVAVVPDKIFSFQMILSNTVFSKADYSIINRAHKRILKIKTDRDIYILPCIHNGKVPVQLDRAGHLVDCITGYVQNEDNDIQI
ncbi:MAG: hypothetical protein HFH68_05135 [Lachnospiraceae bacterium]|nr:hypothetical protein [Lachnospiraceae bacterium]